MTVREARAEGSKKFGSHAFAIHNDPPNGERTGLLLVALHNRRQPAGQMMITSVGG